MPRTPHSHVDLLRKMSGDDKADRRALRLQLMGAAFALPWVQAGATQDDVIDRAETMARKAIRKVYGPPGA